MGKIDDDDAIKLADVPELHSQSFHCTIEILLYKFIFFQLPISKIYGTSCRLKRYVPWSKYEYKVKDR